MGSKAAFDGYVRETRKPVQSLRAVRFKIQAFTISRLLKISIGLIDRVCVYMYMYVFPTRRGALISS